MIPQIEKYQAVLLVSFGGPEGMDDVMPFLKNVLRGRNVPEERMLEVAKHYHQFGGVSPINEQNRQLISALEADFRELGIALPIYFGNRNWHPMLEDTLQQMKSDGIQTAVAFFTSAYSCYSGCRQYRENIFHAQRNIGEGAPEIEKVRMCYNHPKFIEAIGDRVKDSLTAISESKRESVRLLFTAHSIPEAMATNCNYELQLRETSRLVAESVGNDCWELVFQSRSGPPSQPWLEPDVCDRIENLALEGATSLVIVPVGFLSDHMEVMFDLDVEAKEACQKHGIEMVRAATVGTHPTFVRMISEMILERADSASRPAIGQYAASHDVCPKNCCLSGRPGATSPV